MFINAFSVLGLSPLSRGGDSRDVGKDGSPEGQRLCEPFQNSEKCRFPHFSVKPLPWRGQRGLGIRLRSALPLATEGTQEAPSYEEGVGVDGGFAASGCIKMGV